MLSYIHVVTDLDKSFAFYRDTFGFPIIRAPSEWHSGSELDAGSGSLGAGSRSKERSAAFALPGTDVELRLMEYAHVKRVPRHARNSDMGASTLSVIVRDLDATLAAALRAGASVVTVGGAPRVLQSQLRLIFLKDPDGFFIELENTGTGDGSAAGSSGNAISAHAGFTVLDSAKTESFYRSVLGMEYRPAAGFMSMKVIEELIDVPDIQFKVAFARLPGSTMEWEFLEFHGSDNNHQRGHLQDPGTAGIALSVADIDSALRSIRAGAGEAAARGGKPVVPASGERVAFVRDPNGIPLELVQAP